MNKLRIMMLIIAMTVLPAVCFAQDAGQVVDRAIDALGGREAFGDVNSIKLTLSGSFPGAPRMQLKVYHIKPGKFRYEWIESRGDRIEASDGKDYWSQISQRTRDMSSEEREEFLVTAEILTGGFLIDLAGRGITATYVGRQTVDGIDSHVVALSAEDRTSVEWAFAVNDGLPHMMRRSDAHGENIMKISDFREVAGLLLARKIEIIRNGETVISLSVDVVEINVPVDETIFTRPE